MRKLFLTIAVLIALPAFAFADIAPAEQISYTFNFSGIKPVKIVPAHSEQIQCEDNQCLNPQPLGRFGIQKLECDEFACHAVSYQLSPYQKLIIKFEDGSVRESEVFITPSDRKNAMLVTVSEGKLEVSPEKINIMADRLPKRYMMLSMIFLLLAEILAAIVITYMSKLPIGIVFWFASINLFTIPLNWIILSNFIQRDGVLWVAAFLIEWAFLAFIYRRKSLGMEVFGITLFSNVAGYSAGMILSFITTFFIAF